MISLLLAAILQVQASPFLTALNQNFDAWDVNRDGVLSKVEVDAAVVNPKFENQAAAALAVIKQLQRGKEQIKTVAKTDLEKFSIDYDKRFKANMGRIRQASEEIFEKGQPNIASIRQGRIGDCFFLAPIGCIAHKFPERLKSMVTLLPNKKVKVKFAKQEITLDLPTDAEIALSSTTEGNGIWINVFEKAFGEILGDKKGSNAKSSTDAIARGGSSRPVLALLTGKETSLIPRGETDALLEIAERAGRNEVFAVMSTNDEVKIPGVSPKHAYSVLGVDGGKILMWNPHGQDFKPKGPEGVNFGYVTKSGIFRVPIADTKEWFGRVVWAELGP